MASEGYTILLNDRREGRRPQRFLSIWSRPGRPCPAELATLPKVYRTLGDARAAERAIRRLRPQFSPVILDPAGRPVPPRAPRRRKADGPRPSDPASSLALPASVAARLESEGLATVGRVADAISGHTGLLTEREEAAVRRAMPPGAVGTRAKSPRLRSFVATIATSEGPRFLCRIKARDLAEARRKAREMEEPHGYAVTVQPATRKREATT